MTAQTKGISAFTVGHWKSADKPFTIILTERIIPGNTNRLLMKCLKYIMKMNIMTATAEKECIWH